MRRLRIPLTSRSCNWRNARRRRVPGRGVHQSGETNPPPATEERFGAEGCLRQVARSGEIGAEQPRFMTLRGRRERLGTLPARRAGEGTWRKSRVRSLFKTVEIR